MSEIFNEANMQQALEKYIPNGESLLAGIHALSHETDIKCLFGKCVYSEDRLIPDENGYIISLNKKKHSTYDIYIGITQHYLVITECERNSYLYEFDEVADGSGKDIQKVTSDLLFTDVGTCFPLGDVKNCEIKKGWMGSVKCFLTLKNESSFKLRFPKLGGVGGGMPHHAEYREAIIARLNGK